MRTYPDHLSIERVVCSGAHHCGNVTVAEFACDATAVASAATPSGWTTSVCSRSSTALPNSTGDYWNPLVAIRAMGGLFDALLAVAGEGQGVSERVVVLVTGGTGKTGARLSARLSARGVVSAEREPLAPYGFWGNQERSLSLR